ncbi:hypothetical protein CTZ27_26385 [Streptomyces griseocarneus]|nr:hypothetical protein CTZ27_26385 [Streptomyces griseocarneus]
MTDPPTHDPSVVALELERLRGTLETGFARVDGALALLVQRSDQSDRQLAELEDRVTDLERARWPLPSLAALVAVAAFLLSLWETAS